MLLFTPICLLWLAPFSCFDAFSGIWSVYAADSREEGCNISSASSSTMYDDAWEEWKNRGTYTGSNAKGVDLLITASSTVVFPDEKSDYWVKLANNVNLPISKRRKSVFCLFRRHIKPGLSCLQLSKLLSEAKWLDEKDVVRLTLLFGQIPISDNTLPDNSVFQMFTFPEGENILVIYLAIEDGMRKTEFCDAVMYGKKFKSDAKIIEIGFSGSDFLVDKVEENNTPEIK